MKIWNIIYIKIKKQSTFDISILWNELNDWEILDVESVSSESDNQSQQSAENVYQCEVDPMIFIYTFISYQPNWILKFIC